MPTVKIIYILILQWTSKHGHKHHLTTTSYFHHNITYNFLDL